MAVYSTPDDLAQEAFDSSLKQIESLTAAVREGEASAERDGWRTYEEIFKRLRERHL
jgi:hypothetical protein